MMPTASKPSMTRRIPLALSAALPVTANTASDPHRSAWPRVAKDKADGGEIHDRGGHQQPEQHPYTKDVHIALGGRNIEQQTEQHQWQERGSSQTNQRRGTLAVIWCIGNE